MHPKIYENVIIGNFLYGLGFAMRQHADGVGHQGAVNLLQQTPADTLLGDVLMTFPGMSRLIEFKRKGAVLNKETVRHVTLTKALEDKSALQRVSRRMHLYLEFSETEPDAASIKVTSYLDAFSSDDALTQTMAGCIEKFASDVSESARMEPAVRAAQREEEAFYLKLVRSLQGEGSIGSGGMLLMSDAEGRLAYAYLEDLSALRMTTREWSHALDQKLQRELTRSMSREHSMKRDRGHGLER
ncbi:hypothetical protein [Oleiagrimonas soli]|uniref:Uncharacterized protein n=1 Tax=Oleiagrimonas soli TaxID=1543381 RepID=A0A841KD53_9GAMM|nr:hypothetical protein [Oleiagrimonas soli]MBB6183543.1 hypothetical protein [Oleiagrimonas soli]